MKNTVITLLITAIITAGLLLLVACGNFDPSTVDGSNSSKSVSGVAASGLPISGTVTLTDADGATRSKTTDNEGSFSINVEGLTPPFLVCVNGTVMDRSIDICSTITGAGRANITPITDLILRNVVGVATGNAKANWQTLSTGVDDNIIEQVNEQLALQLESLLQAVGLSNDVDFISTPFDADMTGMDLLLEGLDISYNGAGTVATISNEFDNTNSITDDITTTTDNDSNTLPNDTAISDQFMDDNIAINAIWDELEVLFNGGLPTTGELDVFFNKHVASDFMDSDGTSAGHKHFFSTGTGWPVLNGTISSIINGPVNAADLGSYLKGSWIHVSVTSNNSNKVFRTSVGWDGSKWHWRGNRKFKFRLPDTGMTEKYSATFGEDADYIKNPPSFIDNGDGTVSDLNTGLSWQKTDNGNTRNNANAILYCAQLTHANHSDWRLPSRSEFQTILDYSTFNPPFNSNIFDITSSTWWTSSTSANDITRSLYVLGTHGYSFSVSKANHYGTKCVRGPSYPESDFVNNGDGTVTDLSTGLMWQSTNISVRDWESSIAYCQSLSLAGYKDWRLPNILELETIYDYTTFNPAVNTNYFTMTPANPPDLFNAFASMNYWTSTHTVSGSIKAWFIGFHGGGQITLHDIQNANYPIRSICTRGGY